MTMTDTQILTHFTKGDRLAHTVTISDEAWIDTLVVLNIAAQDTWDWWEQDKASDASVRLRLRAYASIAGRPHPEAALMEAAMARKAAEATA